MEHLDGRILFRDRDGGDAYIIPAVEHIKGDVDALVDDDHARVFAPAPAAARGIPHRRVAAHMKGEMARVSCHISGSGQSVVEDNAVGTARVAESRDSVHADCAIDEMRATAEHSSRRVHNGFCGPRMSAWFEDRVMRGPCEEGTFEMQYFRNPLTNGFREGSAKNRSNDEEGKKQRDTVRPKEKVHTK